MPFERYYFGVFLVNIVVLAKVAESEEGPYGLLKTALILLFFIYLSKSLYLYSLTLEQLEELVIVKFPFLQLFPCNLF